MSTVSPPNNGYKGEIITPINQDNRENNLQKTEPYLSRNSKFARPKVAKIFNNLMRHSSAVDIIKSRSPPQSKL